MGVFAGPEIPNDGLVLALDAGNPRNFDLTKVEVLVVAGGGGGGGRSGGGGGSGGLIYNSNFAVTPGTQLAANVGGGGAGGAGEGAAGSDGVNSVFGALTAICGGGGSGDAPTTGRNGGSGGGGKYGSAGGTGTSGQGFAGGSGTSDTWKAGGGGGAGGVGVNGVGSPHKCGDGGPGLGLNISGTFAYYAGGGGGGSHNSGGGCCDDVTARGFGGIGGGGNGGTPGGYNSGDNATTNTGGGGGGGSTVSSSGGAGGNGGSGIIIVRYPGPQKAIGGTITSVGGDTIHTFTTSGNFTPLVNTNGSAVLGLSDLSGNRNFGTTAGSPTYNSANGGSLSFDGTDDYVTISSGTNFTFGTGDFSMECWYNPAISYANGNGYIFDAGANGTRFQLYQNNLYFLPESGAYLITNTGVGIPPNTWYNVVGTRVNSTINLYLNGSIIGSSNNSNNLSDSGGTIGNYGGGGGYFFNGRISNFRVYKGKGLTAAEVSQNFNALRGRYFRPGSSSDNPATSASEILSTDPYANNGVYWIKPTGASSSFQAYVDFTTANGPWIHIGTAGGNLRGLYTYRDTWCSRTTNSGDITTPYNASASSFNAGSFIYCKGSLIMIKHNQDGYVQASGFNNESWRDVYNFLNSRSAWPAYNTYERELTITNRNGTVSAYNTTGSGLLYGTEATVSTLSTYNHWYVYAFDNGGDTYAYLSTGTYFNTGIYNEADHGIGSNENGPSASTFPGDDYALSSVAFDAGTNDTTDSGSFTTYDGRAFSMWIKN